MMIPYVLQLDCDWGQILLKSTHVFVVLLLTALATMVLAVAEVEVAFQDIKLPTKLFVML